MPKIEINPELSRIAWAASSRIDSARNETRPIYRLPPEILAIIIEFCQSEQFDNYLPRPYKWVCLMLVSRTWRAAILSFPTLWSKLVMRTSVPQSGILTIVKRSGSHPLQVVVPPPARSEVHPKSIRYKLLDLVAGLLPRISLLLIATCGGYDASRIYRAFENRPANQLQRLNFIAVGSDKLFVLHTPRLRFLHLSGVGSWPAPMSENLTHIYLSFSLNPETLERDLKHSPRLRQLSVHGVYQVPERFGNHRKISLIRGARLVITSSRNTVASLFALGSTNYLSVTNSVAVPTLPVSSFLKLALPRDVSHFRNFDDLTTVRLELIDSGDQHTQMPRTVTVVLMCSTVDRETLRINLEYTLGGIRFPDPMEPEIIPERPPAMRVLNYLRPLDLRKVLELRMEGFVGEWGLQGFELYHFLQYMPSLRRITTGDNNIDIFRFALSTLRRSAPVIVEGV